LTKLVVKAFNENEL